MLRNFPLKIVPSISRFILNALQIFITILLTIFAEKSMHLETPINEVELALVFVIPIMYICVCIIRCLFFNKIRAISIINNQIVFLFGKYRNKHKIVKCTIDNCDIELYGYNVDGFFLFQRISFRILGINTKFLIIPFLDGYSLEQLNYLINQIDVKVDK